jgi:undecaprenyl-diphosphatase
VFSVATLPLAYLAGRREGGRIAAWGMLLLLATSPFAVHYATEARMYSLAMLLVTATLLSISYYMRPGTRNIGYLDALIIGIAQAFAVLPGISRSGATITTALFLGNKRIEAARFSFLMVILPIIAANFIDLLGRESSSSEAVGWFPLLVGFVAAFVSGLIACKLMLSIVRRGKLLYFGIYCLFIGAIAIIFGSI